MTCNFQVHTQLVLLKTTHTKHTKHTKHWKTVRCCALCRHVPQQEHAGQPAVHHNGVPEDGSCREDRRQQAEERVTARPRSPRSQEDSAAAEAGAVASDAAAAVQRTRTAERTAGYIIDRTRRMECGSVCVFMCVGR